MSYQSEIVNFVLLSWFIFWSRTECYNVEVNVDKVGMLRGDSGSQFGYTVAIVRAPGWADDSPRDFYTKELLVGAPNKMYNGISGHGQVSRCTKPGELSMECSSLNVTDISNICSKLNKRSNTDCAANSRLGATLAVNRMYPNIRETSPRMHMITVCAPRWKNVYPEVDNKRYQNFMIGMCLKLGDDLKPINCLTGRDRSYCWPFWPDSNTTISSSGRPVFTYAQGGMSAAFTQDGLSEIVGAPGADDWRGAYRAVQKNWLKQLKYTQAKTIYFGYALTSGLFETGTSNNIVSGSPNWYTPPGAGHPGYGHFGKVEMFQGVTKRRSLEFGIPQSCGDIPLVDLRTTIDVDQMGSKFGATLAAVDLTGDGYDELLVGAPLYTGERPEEGRVFVYTSTGTKMCGPIGILSGGANIASLKEKASFARFGTSIASAGDIDHDGYKDVAIGAPYEDDGTGAIYIYHGIGKCECILEDTFAQRITGKELDPGLRAFGWSIYGDEDIDDNSFPDLAVGAYDSDTVVMLRTRPIVHVDVEINITPSPIPLNGTYSNCSIDKETLCFDVIVLFQFEAVGTRTGNVRDITFTWTLDSDTVHTSKEGWSRVQFRDTPGLGTVTQNITLSADDNRVAVIKYTLDVKGYRGKPEPKDAWTNVRMEGSYELISTSGTDFAVLDPILHKDAQKLITANVEFDKKCDSIDECTSDLKLTVDMFLLKRDGTSVKVEEDTMIYIGDANELEVTVDVKNLLNSSYRANITGEVTSVMRRAISSNNGVITATCKTHDSPHRTDTQINCTADSKLDKNENIRVKTYFDISGNRLVPDMNMDNMKEYIHIALRAAQANRDVNTDNNVFERKIGVKLKYDIHVEEDKEASDQIRYKADEKSTRKLRLLHRYYITNEGPSFLPMTYVNITIPVMIGETEIAQIKELSQACIVRGQEHLRQTTTPLPSTKETTKHMTIPETEINKRRRREAGEPKPESAKSTGKKPEESAKDKNITCGDYECLVIECKVTNLKKLEQETIEVTMEVLEKEIAKMTKEKGVREVRYATNATVTDPYIWYGGKVVPWDKTVYAEKWTTFVVEPTSVVSEVNIWIIIVSVLGAILLLIIVTVILWKCGFFTRKKHTQVQQWKRASLYNRKSVRLSSSGKQPYNDMEEKEIKEPT